jgi:predicted nucleic-acid-binding protein
MKAVDTNILVRLVVDDDTEMARAAAGLLEAGPLFVATTVVAETYWLLRSRLGFDRQQAFGLIRDLASHDAIHFENTDAVVAALEALESGLEFGDALHVLATPNGATFVTFDQQSVARWKRTSSSIHVTSP